MCGRFHRFDDVQKMATQFRAKYDASLFAPPTYNAPPQTWQPVIRLDQDGEREIVNMRWGLVPYWSKDDKTTFSTFQPETAAASRIDLSRLLWVLCGTIPEASTSGKVSFRLPKECPVPPAAKKGLYAGGWGGHPRGEVKGLADAVGDLLQTPSPREHEGRIRQEPHTLQGNLFPRPVQNVSNAQHQAERINQARRVTDLLLQGGGFSAIVLDMAGVSPEYSSRVSLDTW